MSLRTIRGELVELPIKAVMGAEFIDPTERKPETEGSRGGEDG